MGSQRKTKTGGRARGPVSWLTLLAATTLGATEAGTLRTEIRAGHHAIPPRKTYRLIVQSYASDGQPQGSSLPREYERPVGSMQRAVTAGDLQRGIHLDLIELRDKGADPASTVVAWLEPGEANLEYDARRARPAKGSLFGVVKPAGPSYATVKIVLDQRLAV